MNLSLADDWRLVDGIETVTFTPRNPIGAAVAGVRALRRVLTRHEISAMAELGVEPDDLVWHLWTETLEGAVPQNGDTITDAAAVTWTILVLAKTTLETRWRAVGRRNR
jgi:hypothetical protein